MSVIAIDPMELKPEFTEELRRAMIMQTETQEIEQQAYDALVDLFVNVLTLAYDSPEDIAYRTERDRALVMLALLNQRSSALRFAHQVLANRANGTMFLPAVLAESLAISSQATGEALIS